MIFFAYESIIPYMPKRSSIKKPSKSAKLVASVIADSVCGEETSPALKGKNPAAVALGRMGGLKGGKARAAKLSPEERRDIARNAAHARWKKDNKSKSKK